MIESVRTLLDALAVSFDLPILDWIAANLWCPALDFAMPIITVLGDAGIFWIALSVLFMITKKYRKIGVGMAFALVMGLLVCNIYLKPTVARIRPYSFEAAVVILLNNKKLGIPAMILACLIAFSRLYLYVHYPTDVIVSIVLGSAFAVLGNYLAHKLFDLIAAKKAK